MYAYLEGRITEQNPACVTVDCGGVGYEVNISLHTYTKIKDKERARLWIYQAVREDALTLFGFADKTEKELFLQLISVSGVGANTARVILSTLSPETTVKAILDGDAKRIQSVKGIGLKTAQRLIVDLRDKVGKIGIEATGDGPFLPALSEERQEAVAALVTLGFAKAAVEKIVDALLAKAPDMKTEDIIKQSLRML
ncbi:MAG: Holliday junction branch migration protein RuvA [Bacteroidetes bacterium]|uniref:Holliday junction branch migration complex subunit RuvA n=1 Tax=Candidatus Pullibacteroides excrementavium TaxID=2840905 RepID=A0A9D9DTK6_9BACT|nr:Holliday junction branch migration protein RuvA [Candidatus Pullibacteroides excrementavium]